MAQKSLFPHMVVGNIVKVPTDTVNNFLINYEVETSVFVSDLVTAYENEEPLTTFETIATDYLENNSDALSDKPALIALFPQFDALVEMLTTDDHTTIQNPESEVFDIIAHESTLWDNAIAHFIANKTSALTNDLILSVKLVGLLKKIQDGTLNTKPKILNFWKKSHVVFPKPPFPLPKKQLKNPPHQLKYPIISMRSC
ncbi:MAG: hypothetical protein ACK4K0_09475 [Flavobacteriales bacterium]